MSHTLLKQVPKGQIIMTFSYASIVFTLKFSFDGAKLLLFFELCKKMYLKKEFCNPLNNSKLPISMFEK